MKTLTKSITKTLVTMAKEAFDYTNLLEMNDPELFRFLQTYMNYSMPMIRLINDGVVIPTREGSEWIISIANFVLAHRQGKVTKVHKPAGVSKLSGKPYDAFDVWEWPWVQSNLDELVAKIGL